MYINMYIISIDIGFEHFAIIGAQVYENFKLDSIILCKLINIKKLVTDCNNSECTLRHDLCITDYMYHLFNIYEKEFDMADYILVERQPPKGFVAVQELIVYKYRDKVVLVSPNAVHKHFMMPKTQKFRKMFTVGMANNKLSKFLDYSGNTRKHDMSDAYVQLMYYLNRENDKQNALDRQSVDEITQKLECFAYLGD